MTKLDYYMVDGACWQSRAVLAYLQSCDIIERSYNYEKGYYAAQAKIGRYENGREQGYILSVSYKEEQMNYAFYEHINTDSICVVAFKKWTINTPTAEDVWAAMKDKYDVTKSFEYGSIVECGKWLKNEVDKFIDAILAK